MKTILLFSTVFLFPLFSSAYDTCKSEYQRESECCDYEKSSSLTFTKRLGTSDGGCTANIYSSDKDHSFRRFGFGKDGQVAIFLQPGGNSQKSNSSQSFLIFPFGELPQTKNMESGEILVRSGSGQNWKFDPKTSLPTSLEGCQLEVSQKFSLQDSGVKIKSCQNHLVVEQKVEVGGDSIQYPERAITIRDPKGGSCEIKNSDLYNYPKTSGAPKEYMDSKGRYYNQTFKFKTNQDLGRSLKKLCANLDVSMLLNYSSPNKKKVETLNAEEQRALDILEGRK